MGGGSPPKPPPREKSKDEKLMDAKRIAQMQDKSQGQGGTVLGAMMDYGRTTLG